MPFTIETEQNNKISFLDVNVICEQDKRTISVYQKPIFSGVYIHFDAFLPGTYNVCMICTTSKQMFSYMLKRVNGPFTIDRFNTNISERWLSTKFH